MKRYALFCFESYYPSGGWYDIVETFRWRKTAIKEFEQQNCKYGTKQLVDLKKGKLLLSQYEAYPVENHE